MSIPKHIIQTGRCRNISPLAKVAVTNLKLLHPDWDYTFFDDEGVSRFIATEFPRFKPVFDRFEHHIQRLDFFRYLAVYRFGGFYFDLDVLLSEDLSKLLDEQCVFPFEELTLNSFLRRHGMDWEIGNYAFGAAPAHPFLEVVIENCVKAQRDRRWVKVMMAGIPRMFHADFYVLNTTGPGLISRTFAENPKIADSITILFPENVCDPATWHKFGTLGIHLMNGSWRTQHGFVVRRIASWWEAYAKKRLMMESIRLGPARRTDRRPAFIAAR